MTICSFSTITRQGPLDRALMPPAGKFSRRLAGAGAAIARIMPPVSRFSSDKHHDVRKQSVLDKPAAFFERYFGLM